MSAVDDHYEFLGLQPSASREGIEAAIERLSERAAALVYTSPAESSTLWERVRQMRRDLLATAEGRQVYDDALRRRNGLAEDVRVAATLNMRAFRPPGEARAMSPGERSPTPQPSAEPGEGRQRSRRSVAWPYALISAVMVFALAVGTLLSHASEAPKPPARVAMALWQLGATRASEYVSGQSVTLAWTRVPRAAAYRLQLATGQKDESTTLVFARSNRTVGVTSPQYRFSVTGRQVYFWRVQALVDNHWQPYSLTRHFAVALPSIGQPVAYMPAGVAGRMAKSTRLCWSPVLGASGYRLLVEGQSLRTVRATCISLRLRPGTYRWSVAAMAHGAETYTGTYSISDILHVRDWGRKTVKQRPRRKTMRHITIRRSGRTEVKPFAAPPTARTIEVAFALPRNAVHTNHRLAPHSLHRLTHPNRIKLDQGGPALRRAKRSVTATAVRRARPHLTGRKAARLPFAAAPVRTPHPLHSRRGQYGAVVPTRARKTPSRKGGTRPSTVVTSVPLPPAPPAPPARTPAITPVRPTAVAATISQSPLSVRAVGPGHATTSTVRSSVPFATPSVPPLASRTALPVATLAVPAPTSTQAPSQSPSDKHSNHPAHPVRPKHR